MSNSIQFSLLKAIFAEPDSISDKTNGSPTSPGNSLPLAETKTAEDSSQKSSFAFEGQMRKLGLERKFLADNTISTAPTLKFTPNPNIKFAASVRRIGGDDVIEETKRVLENYRRQIKPSEIKGSQPVEGGKTSGHAHAKHRVNPEVQAEILNKPDRIFSGINDNGRYVDIYYKNGSAVITEFGKKESVITGYGLIDQRKPNPKPFNLEKVANNARYVEVKLEKLGAINIIYPNKTRFDNKDFPNNPPKPDAPLKTNGGGTTGGNIDSTPTATNPIGQKPSVANEVSPTTEVPVAEVPANAPKIPVTGEPPTVPKVAIEEPPILKPLGGLSDTLNNGIILLQLIQIGIVAYDASQMEADGKKYGFYVDPLINKYIITDPDKAAQNLPKDFELKFYFDPTGYYSTGPSVTFKVQNGKFVNIDKNFPDYKLYINDKGLVRAGILL